MRSPFLYTILIASTSIVLLTRPDTHGTVSTSFNQIAILYSNVFNDGVCRLVVLVSSGSAVPVPSVCLVVDLDYVCTCCRNNPTRVEHHAANGVVVSVSVSDGAGSEIPDLCMLVGEQSEERWLTYAYTPVGTTGHEMDIVELQGCDRACVTDETSVNLPATQIP